MKRKRNVPETHRLMSRWVMLVAHTMVEQRYCRLDFALHKANLAAKLLNLLGNGAVRFTYIKEDNEPREAYGTLCRGIDPMFDIYESKGNGKRCHRDNSNTDGIYTYWDIDKHAFRSFLARNLISINEY